MSSLQQKNLFPLFSKTSLKQSPTKSSIYNAHGQSSNNLSSQKGDMNRFIESKIPKAIKLNNLNEIQSMHSSVYQSANHNTLQNSLRNVVNSSYFNSTQQSIYTKNEDLNNLASNQRNLIRDSSSKKMRQVKPIERNRLQNSSSQLNQNKKLDKIRSRSSSQLSVSKNSSQQSHLYLTSPQNNQMNPSLVTLYEKSNFILQSFLPLIEQLNSNKQRQLQISQKPVQDQVQLLFTKYFSRGFIRSLIEFMNKNWSQNQNSLLQDKKIKMIINIIIQKFTHCDQLINDFIQLQFGINYSQKKITQTSEPYTIRELKLISSILFKQCQKAFEQMRKLFEQLIGKLPQDGIVQQEFILDELKKSILEIYDPKFTYSSVKMKERFTLYYEAYCSKRTSLETEIKHKLKPQLSFIKEMETYLGSYQKQLMKLNSHISNLEQQKEHLMELLKNKTTFKPLQIDFRKLADLKQASEERIKKDFEQNIVQFHRKIHQKDADTIAKLKQQNKTMKKAVQQKQRQKQYHISKLQDYLNSIPKKRDASTQIFNLPIGNNSSNQPSVNAQNNFPPHQLALYPNFLTNIITPFTFNQKITSSLISIITVDKILYDYEPIKLKSPLISFRHYVFEWFIIRTGSKKIAQILLKNFIYSVKKYRNKHKRFSIFNKICAYSGLRKKNLQEDIEFLFYQSNLAWYYLVKLALMFRKRLNENPNGYHIFPPINCQDIFKLSLRKTYELIEQFFVEEEITVPENLSQKIDHYAINEISKFKQNDEEFQKRSLQQIHILREMNFDVIAGFILDYVASNSAVLLEGFLRSVHLKQEQDKNSIGYSQFEVIYRKYYKQKRSKIELIYSKFCLCNMYDVLNADNMTPVIMLCIQDEAPLRMIFDRHESLKCLIISEKQAMNNNLSKYEKKVQVNPNSYEHFKERYYQQFYDFYDVTIMLEEIFRIVKGLVKKKLKKLSREETYIESLLQTPKGVVIRQQQPSKSLKKQGQSSNEQSEQQQQNSPQEDKDVSPVSKASLQNILNQKSSLEQKLQEWAKIQQRIPHFTTKILTIDQIVVHNMRRKQMFQGCQFAWRTLREILVAISK